LEETTSLRMNPGQTLAKRNYKVKGPRLPEGLGRKHSRSRNVRRRKERTERSRQLATNDKHFCQESFAEAEHDGTDTHDKRLDKDEYPASKHGHQQKAVRHAGLQNGWIENCEQSIRHRRTSDTASMPTVESLSGCLCHLCALSALPRTPRMEEQREGEDQGLVKYVRRTSQEDASSVVG
jgi:hypothetical protein